MVNQTQCILTIMAHLSALRNENCPIALKSFKAEVFGLLLFELPRKFNDQQVYPSPYRDIENTNDSPGVG